MNVYETGFAELLVIEPKVFGDERGFFLESWNQKKLNDVLGKKINFVQDNHSKSALGTLRGLHFQTKNIQSKLVRVTSGSVFDVVVDLRKEQHTFGKTFSINLTAENKKQLFIPKGFAHGFLALENETEFLYKCDDYYNPNFENSLLWNDLSLNIDWPIKDVSKLLISNKDAQGISFSEVNKIIFD